MAIKYTREELKNMSSEAKDLIIISMQDQLEALNENIEKLIEQVRIANQYRFGRHSEKLSVIDGQISLFDEAEATYDENIPESDINNVIPSKPRKTKSKGKRDADLDAFEQEIHLHDVSKETLDSFYGTDNWKEMPEEVYKRLRHIPAKWITEVHTINVYVETDGDHQDEFYRGDRPKDLLKNSIVTPSLAAAIFNGKFVNSLPFYSIEQEFERNDVHISKQDMSNWTVNIATHYFV